MIQFDSVSLTTFLPLPEGKDQYPFEFIESQGAIKLKDEQDRVIIGLTEKATESVIDMLKAFHTQSVLFHRVNSVELSAYLGNKLGETTDEHVHGSTHVPDDRLLLDKLANDAPIINMVNSICIEGIRSGSSDIHIEASPESARVRYRIDGQLRTVRTLDLERFPAISSRIKIMANLNILERRQPQDGRITVSVGNEHIDLRVSIIPVTGGESIVLRILGKKDTPLSLQELGFGSNQLAIIQTLLKIPHGLVLVTGPTGSGKTTTLNAMIREIVSDTLKVITIEDPVEYLVDGVNQIQINEQIHLSFDTILRRVLRQDPNVIMVGEIRDGPTAEIAVRAALTGHLVFSTLHTNDAASVITRLTDMGIEPYLTASVLRGAIAQRLVRRVCPACSKPRVPDEREVRILSAYGIKVKRVSEGTGCQACGFSGYQGRTVLSEMFHMDSGLEERIVDGERLAGLSSYLTTHGMRTLAQEALQKVAEGITTLKEIEREIVLEGVRV